MATDDTEVGLLREIRDLLLLIAEPQLAERDKAQRERMRSLAGKGKKNIEAVLLMDGSRSQAVIVKEAPIDQGQLARLVKSLRDANLLRAGSNPQVAIPVSRDLFEGEV